MRHITLIVAVVALALAAPAFSGKGGVPGGSGNGGNNGNGGGNGNATVTYAPTLVANPNVVHAGDYFDVSGCGYKPEYGNVVVGFTGGGWGSPLDSSGCFTIAGLSALSGDTLPSGTYPVTAYQYISGTRTEVAGTSVTVVE